MSEALPYLFLPFLYLYLTSSRDRGAARLSSFAVTRSVIGGTTAIALLLLAAAYTFHFVFWDFDDTYIVFRIVRNLLNGDGWTFNIGEAHNASTSVLNTAVIALAAPVFSSNIPLTAHVLAGIWLSVAALTFGWVLWQRFSPWVALGAGVALIVTLGDNALWGLETHLFMALFGVFVVLEHQRKTSWAVIGLLTLTRPDALILAVLRCLRDVRVRPWPAGVAAWRETVRAAWTANRKGLLVFALVLAPWVIFSLITFQQVFPDTLSNKMWQGRSGFWGTGRVYLQNLVAYVGGATSWRAAGYLLALPGLVFLVRDRSVLLYVIAFAVLQHTAYAILNVPGYHWYFASLDVAAVLAAFYCLGSVFQIVVVPHMRVAARSAALALYAGVLAYAALRAMPLVRSHYPEDNRETSYREIGAAMVANRIPAGAIAVVEVGTLGYYLPARPMLDLTGLTSPNPEYVSGEHNDRFFAEPPSVVVLRDPVSPLERAIFDDIRFRMLYDGPVATSTTEPRMQYFTRRRGSRPPTPEDIAAYVEGAYPRFLPLASGPVADAQPSRDAVCMLDQVNEQLARPPVTVPRLLLSLTGWAYDRTEEGPPGAEVFALLTSGERRYSIQVVRVPRPDVAAAFKEPRFERSGYTVEGSIVSLPPGEYRVSIVQRSGEGFVSCDVPQTVTITAAIR